MTSGEIAALVTAFGVSMAAILTAIAALLNARNGKDIAERLRGSLQDARQEITDLQEHNVHQDKLLLVREVELGQMKRENSALNRKVELWQDWGDRVGQTMNQMQLTIGFLTRQQKQQSDENNETARLPTQPGPFTE